MKTKQSSGTRKAPHSTGTPAAGRLTERQAGKIARALAEPRRVKILRELAASAHAMTCNSLSLNSEVSTPTVSHHLKELENAGLIEVVRQGKFVNLSLQREMFDAYVNYLREI